MVSSAVAGNGGNCKSITKTSGERMLTPEDRISNEFDIDSVAHSPDYEFRFSVLPDSGTDTTKDYTVVVTATYFCKFSHPK
eukprot:4937329-Pleurochrysis_carterae.AAC.1